MVPRARTQLDADVQRRLELLPWELGHEMPKPLIAIAPFIESCPGVITLGVRPALCDYSTEEKRLINSADRIFFPTPRFAKIFEAAGKQTFPNSFTYQMRRSRVLEATFLQYSGCPHPRTRLYFGRQKASIASDFRFPLIAMGPNRSDSAGVIQNSNQLADAAAKYNPLIVREFIEYRERMLLVFVNYECVAKFSGLPGGRDFSSPVTQSAAYSFLTQLPDIVRSFNLCDIGVELGYTKDRGLLIDSFARPPLSWKTPEGAVNRHQYISGLIQKGEL